MKLPPLIILAGGKGTRLGNLTKDIPKPMVDIHGTPFLEILIYKYWKQGFREIYISIDHLHEQITSYPFSYPVSFIYDQFPGSGKEYAIHHLTNRFWKGAWFVNGDTYLFTTNLALVDTSSSCILSCADVDAGAQYIQAQSAGLVKIKGIPAYLDIGTPQGLEKFRGCVWNYYNSRTEWKKWYSHL